MNHFLTASQLHAQSRRFLDAYSTWMQPLSRELSLAQTALDILLFLANNPENQTARDICAMRHLKPGIVSLHVETLVCQRLLAREPVPGDRRKLRLVPTEQAEPIIAKGRAMQASFAEMISAGLREDELESFTRCLAVISQNLERAASGAEPAKKGATT